MLSFVESVIRGLDAHCLSYAQRLYQRATSTPEFPIQLRSRSNSTQRGDDITHFPALSDLEDGLSQSSTRKRGPTFSGQECDPPRDISDVEEPIVHSTKHPSSPRRSTKHKSKTSAPNSPSRSKLKEEVDTTGVVLKKKKKRGSRVRKLPSLRKSRKSKSTSHSLRIDSPAEENHHT